MAMLTKTTAQFVTAVEDGTIAEIQAALKKPGADRVVMVVRIANADISTHVGKGLEVWDVG